MLSFFYYRFKSMIKNKSLVFWILIFPIILVTLFNLAFSNIDSSKLFEPFSVAVVNGKDSNMVKVMEKVEYNDKDIFKIEHLSKEEALKKLEENEVAGIVELKNDTPEILVRENSSNQLILQEFVNSYQQKTKLIEQVVKDNPQVLTSDWVKDLNLIKDYVKDKEVSERSGKSLIISFYSAIAMACLYGSLIAVYGMRTIQPNISRQGARLNVSPYKKSKIIIVDFLASLILVLTSVVLLILYMNYVLNVEFGGQIGEILSICLMGALFSTAVGYLLCLLLKKKEGLTIGVVIAVTMVFSFLAGMMSPQIKYTVEQALPFIKYINPAALMSDSFYTIYYYGDFTMTYPYLLSLFIMFVICISVSILLLRGDSHDSI